MIAVQGALVLAIDLYRWVLFAYVLLSWVPRPPDALVPVVLGVQRLVDPVVRPLRRVIPPLRLGAVALDLSVLVLFLLLGLVRALLRGTL